MAQKIGFLTVDGLGLHGQKVFRTIGYLPVGSYSEISAISFQVASGEDPATQGTSPCGNLEDFAVQNLACA
eukprot:425156-Amphidinium_carterae.1